MSDELEQQLRHALRRQQPPPGFAERVLAAAAHQAAAREETALPSERLSWWLRLWAAPRWAHALVAAVLVLVLAGAWLQVQQARSEALARQEHATRQVLFALRLASKKTAPAREALRHLGILSESPAPASEPVQSN
ncbi:MAG: hypothetical protein KIT83_00655 [Bryobacterales bacterium]|nr:hypothetical protein [Bryobacterales bacterium]